MIQHLDNIKVIDRNGHLIIEGYHHDGSNHYELKRLNLIELSVFFAIFSAFLLKFFLVRHYKNIVI